MNSSATAAAPSPSESNDPFDHAFTAMDDIESGTRGLEEDIQAVANVADQVQAIAKQTNHALPVSGMNGSGFYSMPRQYQANDSRNSLSAFGRRFGISRKSDIM